MVGVRPIGSLNSSERLRGVEVGVRKEKADVGVSLGVIVETTEEASQWKSLFGGPTLVWGAAGAGDTGGGVVLFNISARETNFLGARRRK